MTALALLAPRASAQVNSNAAGVFLQAGRAEVIRVAALPGTVNFALSPNGIAGGSSAITITTSWSLIPSVQDVNLYAYFASSAAALTDGLGNNIPPANVLASVNGTAFAPFTGNGAFAVGSSMLVFTERIIGNNKNKTRSDILDMQIDTTGLGLPAGTYTGVLLIQAQAL